MKKTFLTLTAIATLALTGCTSNSVSDPTTAKSPSPVSSVTTTATQTPSPTVTPTTSPTATPTMTPAPSPHPTKTSSTSTTKIVGCTPDDVKLTLSKENGAAGTGYYDFVITNTSSKACTLKGYPEVEVVGGGNGTQIGKPLSHAYWSYKAGVKTNPQLTLKAKSGKAYAQLAVPSIYNYSTDDTQKPVYKADYNSTCGSAVKADGYRMQLPGEGTSLYVAVSGGFPYCSATKQAIARNSEFVSSPTSD